jgi:hypothetical protein
LSIRIDIRQAWIKYQVYAPTLESENELELRGESYLVRIFLHSEDIAVIQQVQKVVYRFGPDFPYRIIESSNWRTNFDCKIFSSRRFEFEFEIYLRNNFLPYTGRYNVDIFSPDPKGFPVPLG